MKVRFIKCKLIEVQKTKLEEVWDKQVNKWDELNIEYILPNGKFTDLVTYEGDVYLNVPRDMYEVLP